MTQTIVWFRRDLRIADHAPIYRAAMRGDVIPLFILDRALLHHPEVAPARVEFMLNCLRSLDQDLRARGGRLIVRFGEPCELLPQLIRQTGAEGIYAYIDYERIYGRVRDAAVNEALAKAGQRIRWFEPVGGAGELMAYPQYRALWYGQVRQSLVPTPQEIRVPADLHSDAIPAVSELGLIPDIQKPQPPAGTAAARQLLRDFAQHKSDRYYWQLSYPRAEATTGVSPHLKFGAISVRECYQLTEKYLRPDPDLRVQRSRRQLISRLRWGSGFAQRFRYLPQLELRSLYQVFDDDDWDFDEDLYNAWRTGHTGFPIVDAAARCLLGTGGWKALNFRSRAIYASFLSNLLGIDWRYGALHFMQHLIDGDCPIDHYQWAMQAGVTHCLNKSWTRIYNPGQVAVDRCDPQGEFIKHWLPELAHLPPSQLGSPTALERQRCGYPAPILDYKDARQRRVRLLERQRSKFLSRQNVVPHLARLPKDWTPFGSDRPPLSLQDNQAFATDWAKTQDLKLFPPALDLEQLGDRQAKLLRTWFIASGNVRSNKNRSRRRRQATPIDNGQLPLFDLEAWSDADVMEDSGLAGERLEV